jgi:outer membrane protein OmpA-like peptidoglycan-associated protein
MEDPKAMDEYLKSISDVSSAELIESEKQQQKEYKYKMLIMGIKKDLLSGKNTEAKEKAIHAYKLMPDNTNAQYYYGLTHIPEVSIRTASSLISLVQEKNVTIHTEYVKGKSHDTWVENWELHVYDQNEQEIKTIHGIGNIPEDISIQKSVFSHRGVSSIYYFKLTANSDWKLKAETETVKVTVLTKNPSAVISLDTQDFIPGKKNVSILILSNNITAVNWELTIADSAGNIIRTISGEGNLPHKIDWDTKNNDNELVGSGNLFSITITGKDKNNIKWESNTEKVKSKIEIVKKKQTINFNIDSITFKSGKADIEARYIPIIKMVVDILKEYPEYTVQIIGHTDDVGKEVFNKKLSLSRAQAVRKEIEKYLSLAGRITAFGKGESVPIRSNKTEKGRAKNRRVEFKLIKKK